MFVTFRPATRVCSRSYLIALKQVFLTTILETFAARGRKDNFTRDEIVPSHLSNSSFLDILFIRQKSTTIFR